jgi:RHS repeat-associated protein
MQNRTEKYPTITQYDPAGRVSRVILPEGYKGEAETSISYTYNEPWETIETHSVGRSKRTVKNARGQVLYIEDSGKGDPSTGSGTGAFVSAKIGFAYDIAGNRVKKMDLNNTTMALDVPSSLFAPGVKDESGSNIACWRYNAFGQVTESSDPDLGYAAVSYNAFGEASTRTDGLGRTTIFTYDRLGRLTHKELPGVEGTVVYSYDTLAGSDNALGRMTAIDDPSQRKEFSYDKIGRVKQEKRQIKGVAGAPLFDTYFQYDLLSRKTRITYPPDLLTNVRIQAAYGHCAMGVTSITISNGQTSKDVVSGISYNEFGQMTEVRRGNGTVTTYSYDIKGRLEGLLTTAQHNGQTWKVQDVKYDFKVDNSIAAVENNPDVDASGACIAGVRYEYTYDGLNRLVHARGNYEKTRATAPEIPGEPLNPFGDTTVKKFELGYAYAANGNLTGKSVYDTDTGFLSDAWTYSYDNHAVTGITTTSAGARFAMVYDAAGNMITQSDSTKNLAKQMAYDSYNRIRQVTDQNTGTIKGKYWYDDQGFRVRRSAQYTVDGQERQVELLYPSMYFSVETQKDLQGNPVGDSGFGVSNIYLSGVRVAAVLPNADAQYYLTDQVDSVKVVTNDSGMVVTSHEYLPFGEDWITEGDTKNAPKYNSQELDKESGYYFYNARHYDPEIARFVTADNVIDGEKKDENGKIISSDTQGWNRFSYVRNNPILYKDPTGHWKDESQTINYNYKNNPESDVRGIDMNKGTVTKGDSIVKLAENQLMKEKGSNKFTAKDVKDKVEIIKDLNNLKDNTIKPGQKLLLGFSNDRIVKDAGADGSTADNLMFVAGAHAAVKGTQTVVGGVRTGGAALSELFASKSATELMLKAGSFSSALKTGLNNKTLDYLSKVPPQVLTFVKNTADAAIGAFVPSPPTNTVQTFGAAGKKIIDESK